MKPTMIGVAAALLVWGAVGDSLGQPAPPPGGMPPPAWSAHWTPAQLEQLVAPIALYPDPLLGSILAASTYPLEVVEAARWLDDPSNAALTGDALAGALAAQGWDPSVKSLVPFAAVLRQMDTNLEWTEQLGDAFLAQQSDVMDTVQRLRQRAAAQGALQSTPQQTVTTDENEIAIEPTNPDVVYVPYYVPAIYGPWPWPGYPPYDFGWPPDVFIGGGLIGFGIGIGVFWPTWWGWYGCNWNSHGIVYRPPYPGYPGRPGGPPGTRPAYPGSPEEPWHHDPRHRGGVPYRDAGTVARYQGAEAGGRHEFRGFPRAAVPGRPLQPAPAPHPRESRPAPGGPTPAPRPSHERPAAPGPGAGGNRPTPRAPLPRQAREISATPAPRAAPRAFESFGRGPQVRSEAARGSSSRSAPPPPAGGRERPGH
ncbi:MAG TPA: DUF3300 domain-containing protein [Steroidobacteraceae bacterium]|nr:DUF3300 domain-containing protein [Steroidobacteraceae bacterium]